MGLIYSASRKTLPAIAAVSIVANLFLKQKAISELHDPQCCLSGVMFSDLGPPKIISAWTAHAYHISFWVFIGSLLSLIIAEYLRSRS
ncbi:hypothetical protein [Sphingomonas sp. Leaf357]|uniref:hypothetical protein n=1 Tax=Sphingomonas sp. Leaf357 TaxID=1736350 RepID=UPI000AECAB71|nr:hypothetical protein [Sphingomonas sp. Leaf357]